MRQKLQKRGLWVKSGILLTKGSFGDKISRKIYVFLNLNGNLKTIFFKTHLSFLIKIPKYGAFV